MRRALIACSLPVLALVVLLATAGSALGQSGDEPEPAPVVRMARATWDTGWFQAEIYRILLQRLGYQVDGPTTMENPDFYQAVASGEVDLWANGWFPTHDGLLDDRAERVGTQVDDGALQGYFMDRLTAEAYGITDLGDLADPTIAALFDRNGDGRADLVGCEVGWGCAEIINHHLRAYGLTATVEQVQGDYSPMLAEVISRARAGQPVIYYTWTPNWTVGELVPGRDVIWLETPFPSLPADQDAFLDRTAIAGLRGCANDPCQVGWPPNDIRAVANSAFLEANPAVRRLLEQVVIPLGDISHQNALMVEDEGDPEDIRRHAQDWVARNWNVVSAWIEDADPDAVALEDAAAGSLAAPGGVLKVAARHLPPFVMYNSGKYSGFEIELVELIAARLGMATEIYAVDTVAKQVDDINRGVAGIGLGGVAITGPRENVIDFSLPVLDTGLTILVPTTASETVGDRISVFLRAIANSDLPWLLVVFGVAVLVSAHVIWWLERRHNSDFAVPYRTGIWDSFYWSVVTMSTVGYGDKVARGGWGRLFALVWIALGTLVFASFTAAIASSLAVSELRGDIAGPTDLPGNQIATVHDSAGHAYLSGVGVGPVAAPDIEHAYEMLADGEVDAVVFDAPVLWFHVSRRGGGEVTTVGPVFEKVQYGLMLSENDAGLRERVNLAILDLIESGAYQQVHDRWFGALG